MRPPALGTTTISPSNTFAIRNGCRSTSVPSAHASWESQIEIALIGHRVSALKRAKPLGKTVTQLVFPRTPDKKPQLAIAHCKYLPCNRHLTQSFFNAMNGYFLLSGLWSQKLMSFSQKTLNLSYDYVDSWPILADDWYKAASQNRQLYHWFMRNFCINK